VKDALRELLDEIRRLQLLVCAYLPDGEDRAPELPFDKVQEGLHISPEECGTVIRRLSLEGLLESIHAPGLRGPQAVRLTSEGRRLLEAMGAAGQRTLSA
jgi:DNA-binding MarR family transcriptional regulator